MVTLQQVQELVRTELGTISLSDSRASFFNWVPSGVIALDRSGSLKLLRNALKRSESSPKLTEGESVSRSNHAIYNLAQTQRMSDSPDPVYERAVDLRMLYQLFRPNGRLLQPSWPAVAGRKRSRSILADL